MYTLNISSTRKTCQSMKADALFLKTIINKLDFLKKQLLFNETSEKKIYDYLQLK